MNLTRTLLLAAILVPGFFGFPLAPQAAGIGQGGPVEITSEQLDVNQTGKTATFTGNVVVKQGGFTLTAPKVTADYGGAGSDVKSIEATGGTTIIRTEGAATEKAVGTTAVYNPAGQQLTLTGDVTLTRGPSVLSGDKLVYDMATGNARVTNSTGPVKARFVPGAK